MIKNHLDVLGDIYYVEANALRRSGVPGWGTFIDKELQGGGPLIDYGIHMLDTAMYITGFPKVKSVRAYSFQKLVRKKFREIREMGSKQIHSRRCNFWHTGIRKRQDHPTEYFVCFEYQRRQTECGFLWRSGRC